MQPQGGGEEHRDENTAEGNRHTAVETQGHSVDAEAGGGHQCQPHGTAYLVHHIHHA